MTVQWDFYIDYETSRVHINANKAQALTYYDKELGQYIDIDADYLMELLQSKATSIYI
jgi:hypothetical protein